MGGTFELHGAIPCKNPLWLFLDFAPVREKNDDSTGVFGGSFHPLPSSFAEERVDRIPKISDETAWKPMLTVESSINIQ